MLKALITIDCDACRESYETAVVCDDQNLWPSYAWDLASMAAYRGWDVDENHSRFLCKECAEELDEDE